MDEDEYNRLLHEKYVEQRQEADRFGLEIGARYEKFLSFIAGGALVVSFTFVEKIADDPVRSSWLILAAWLLLVIGISSTLFAINFSHKALHRKIENLDNEITKQLNPDDKVYQELDTESNPYTTYTNRANLWSLWTTIVGLVALCVFTFLNFPNTKTEPTAEDNEQQTQQKSVIQSFEVSSSSTKTKRIQLLHSSQVASPPSETEEKERLDNAGQEAKR